ncbi:MAG: carboxypeptidase regulatory-like domain-containing protein [Bacteroidetes bacterium]|nr:carboxypeptidase regulatory-like domain-containing protein [Bacteroidota bacterium]
MLRKLLSTLSVVVVSVGLTFAQNESAIKVRLTDKANKETIPFANVIVEMGGIQSGVGTTNIDGEVTIKPLNPGRYTVKSTYVGYQSVEVKDVQVAVGKTVYINVEMTAGTELKTVEIIDYKEPLIDPDTKSGGTVTREEYQNMASKNINSVAATTAGVYQKDEGGELNIRGSRSNGTSYYVDGQKVLGSSGVPQGGVEQVTAITGGTPAEYGDATGGIISITTRGPASMYTGGIELITSGAGEKNGKSRGLDAFGYNFVGFSLNGPLLMKKDSVNNNNKSVLGFSVAGQYVSEKDPDPSAVGFYQVNPDKLTELENAPLRPSPQGAGYVLNSEYVTMADLQKIKARNNVASNALSLTGKLQYQPSTNMNITLGGSVDYNKNHAFTYEYALFNPSNNAQVTSNTWRVYGKLTQKFNSASTKEEEKSSSVIKNAYFTLQAGYEKTTKKTEDDTHKDKFFDYGYIGKFTQTKQKSYQPETRDLYDVDGDGKKDTVSGFFMNGYQDVSLSFTPGDANPTGTPYTTQFYDYFGASNVVNIFDVQSGLGLANGDRPRNVYSAWYNTGRQYNGYSLEDKTQFRVFANFSADIKRHAIQVGFEYEQRVQSQFNLNPIGLWTRMRELANYHLYNLQDDSINDATLNTDIHYFPDGTISPYAYYDFNRLNDGTQTQFDKSLREKLGYNVNGKFNVVVRIDRFDANQKVLKDKYLLYEAKTAGELSIPNRPSNIGDDYVVYVEDAANPDVNQVVGYRNGDTWYNKSGVEVSDPSASFGQGAGQVQPYLVNPNDKSLSSKVFKDYVPQINVMPRIAFSFPISDVANFYAHYDVLTQRPPDYNRLDPLQYLGVVNNQDSYVNNPDLKAEKTTDYELGYTQVLNEKKNSSLNLSLFYRELKDLVQTTSVVQAYPNTYKSFANVDFGTVKGLSIAYDLRRSATGVSLNASYTLQFADGTGSSTSDGVNLVSSGIPNLRTTHALDFDQRHTITLNVDYRFGAGKDYNGPHLTLHKGKENQKVIGVLEDVGANIVFRAGSGTPYSKQANITHEGQFGIGGGNTALDGQINGSNLPWSYKMDLRIDKQIELNWKGNKEGAEMKTANLTIYLQVLNLLNTKNILAVYKATGNPNDDGYLNSSEAQTIISSQNSPESFRDLYSVKNNNPSNYSRPRVIRLGLMLDF